MRKLVFSLVMVAVLATSGLFAQEVTRSVSTYLDASSQVLDTGAKDNVAFKGNEFEYGVTYGQNFAAAPWLNFSFTILTVMTQQPVTKVDGYTTDADGNLVPGDTVGGVIVGQTGFFNTDQYSGGSTRAKLMVSGSGAPFGVDALGYYVMFDTRTLGAVGVWYGLGFGAAGGLSFGVDVEFWANPVVYTGFGTAAIADKMWGYDFDQNTKYGLKVLDLLAVNVAYSVPFADIFSFTTKVTARFDNGKAPSLQAFNSNILNGFVLRWENTIMANVSGLALWGRVRMDVENLYTASTQTSVEGVTADITKRDAVVTLDLLAGVWYGFSI